MGEVFTNNGESTLNGAINNSVTSVVVTSGTSFPSTGNFRIRIEDEIMLVTARSTNTLTVVRAQEGTAAASHADTTQVREVLTAAVMTNAEVWDEILTKSGDTGRTATTLSDDPHLVSAGTYAAGEVIELELMLIVDCTSATPDMKVGFNASQNMWAYFFMEGSDTTANAALSAVSRIANANTGSANVGANNGRSLLKMRGSISFVAGSATFAFAWGSLNGGASTVTLKAGSKMRIRRLGVI